MTTARQHRIAANKIVRTAGLSVKRGRVDADLFSMMYRGNALRDLHGVDTITAARVITR